MLYDNIIPASKAAIIAQFDAGFRAFVQLADSTPI
jgi:hypothetical protein